MRNLHSASVISSGSSAVDRVSGGCDPPGRFAQEPRTPGACRSLPTVRGPVAVADPLRFTEAP